MYIQWLCEADRLLFIQYHSPIWAMQGHASDPPSPSSSPSSEDDKEMRKLARTLVSPLSVSLLCGVACGRLAGWHRGDPVAPRGNQRQAGDERRRGPIVSCYWNTTHGRGGLSKAVASNKERRRSGGGLATGVSSSHTCDGYDLTSATYCMSCVVEEGGDGFWCGWGSGVKSSLLSASCVAFFVHDAWGDQGRFSPSRKPTRLHRNTALGGGAAFKHADESA